jgi:hypothetical protein
MVKRVQEAILSKEPALHTAVVPVPTLHITLAVAHLPDIEYIGRLALTVFEVRICYKSVKIIFIIYWQRAMIWFPEYKNKTCTLYYFTLQRYLESNIVFVIVQRIHICQCMLINVLLAIRRITKYKILLIVHPEVLVLWFQFMFSLWQF